MDATERAMLRDTVQASLRGARRAADHPLREFGWVEMLAEAPAPAIDIVFTAVGTLNASTSALDDVLLFGLGMEPDANVAVLLPPFGAWSAPGRHDGDRLMASGTATLRARSATRICVVSTDGPSLRCTTVPPASAKLTPGEGLDPDAGYHAVGLDLVASGWVALAATRWDDAVALAQRAISHEIAGATRAMLDLARTHALDRIQFGKPLAGFQAVRHRLAEALVAVEALEATLVAAADEPNPMTAALAKAVAGNTARTVAAHCQQVLAGIGFTADHPFHRYLKRTMVLEGLFGRADDIEADIGRTLLATRRVPTLIEL
jgi:hypothetical protein